LPEFGDDHPVFGVSWHDATAYADWMTRRAEREGWPHRYALPTEAQWRGAGANGGFYPYGDRFRPRWFSSCFTRPTPGAEPVMSFPIDRSILGVYDMTGSMCEWLADAWSESSGQVHVKGGSWAHGGPEDRFRLSGGTGMLPTFTDGTTGFRLVLTITEPPS
jgi:formylglycine-generating enzyme required for sulfatase activity